MPTRKHKHSLLSTQKTHPDCMQFKGEHTDKQRALKLILILSFILNFQISDFRDQDKQTNENND